MAFTRARRLDELPSYLFIEIDRKKKAAIAAGKDVIDLGVGDPDRPTPTFVIEEMARAIYDPKHHRYPFDDGAPEFKREVAAWFRRRFGVELDPATELLSVIGTKEALGHLPLACLNPGDVALIPQPGYPVYQSATIFAGGRPYVMPLAEERGWLPELELIPGDVLRRTRLMFLNYPNNPTGAVADRAFFERCIALAQRHDFIVVQDAAYSEMCFDAPAPSILSLPGARECCIELHSLSKTFNMTGWRLGFAAGNPDVVTALAKVKGNVDSGQFGAIQEAGAAAYREYDRPEIAAIRETYRRRRDVLVDGLRRVGFGVRPPAATFYVFAGCPGGIDSMTCATRMLEEASVVAIPGIGFGAAGEGYVRFALCAEVERIAEAAERIAKIRWSSVRGS
ncbi:MAG: LL-diaminopimelate aminotransferase [Phycisphaerae bacterium]|nr:LL-diaminopimelate aminotransferase [Phycisphaerae bacterium]